MQFMFYHNTISRHLIYSSEWFTRVSVWVAVQLGAPEKSVAHQFEAPDIHALALCRYTGCDEDMLLFSDKEYPAAQFD